jgi:hypothetical protein
MFRGLEPNRSQIRSGRVVEVVMDDLKADWQRWSPGERLSAWCLGVGLSSLVPALLLLS